MLQFGAIVWIIAAPIVFGFAFRSYQYGTEFPDNTTAENIFYSLLIAIMMGMCISFIAIIVAGIVMTAFGFNG